MSGRSSESLDRLAWRRPALVLFFVFLVCYLPPIGSPTPDHEKLHSAMNSEGSRFKEEIRALPQPPMQSVLPSFSVRAPSK
jgi:hypothetical protein